MSNTLLCSLNWNQSLNNRQMEKRELKSRTLGELLYKMFAELKRRKVYADPFEVIELHGVIIKVCKN